MKKGKKKQHWMLALTIGLTMAILYGTGIWGKTEQKPQTTNAPASKNPDAPAPTPESKKHDEL